MHKMSGTNYVDEPFKTQLEEKFTTYLFALLLKTPLKKMKKNTSVFLFSFSRIFGSLPRPHNLGKKLLEIAYCGIQS